MKHNKNKHKKTNITKKLFLSVYIQKTICFVKKNKNDQTNKKILQKLIKIKT